MSVVRTCLWMATRLTLALWVCSSGAACQQTIKARPNALAGIGIVLKTTDDGDRITEVFAGSPAEQAGLAAGDQLLSVDGESTEGKTLASVVSSLRGKPGTAVVIRVARSQGDLTVTLKRQELVKRGSDYHVRVE